MDLELRPAATDDELDALMRCDATAFGVESRDVDRADGRAYLEPERTMCAFEGDRVVGSSATLTTELTLPGGGVAAMAAVTYVSVLPTHRRRGILTAMMGRLLDDARARGEALAGLLASESVIYGRFGYGPATAAASYEIDRGHARLAVEPEPPGRFEVADLEMLRAVCPGVFDRYRRGQPGEVSRSPGWWRAHLADHEHHREGASAQFGVVHRDAGGQPDGYALFRYHEHWHGTPDHVVDVGAVVGQSPAVRLALVGYCFDLDLVSTIRLSYAPVDEPARWALADPRRLKTTLVSDLLWVRLVDVAAALEQRRYPVAGELVIEVDDGFRPENRGRYRLAGGPDGATCRPAPGDGPDLVLGAAELGAAYLGGVRFGTLAAAGRVREVTPGALARASAMFASDPAPYCGTDF
jgi:predicted acetyltransferase